MVSKYQIINIWIISDTFIIDLYAIIIQQQPISFLDSTCYYDSSLMDDKDGSVYPILPWVGGISTDMTPYNCFLGCLKIDMVEKETDLTIGLSPMPGNDGKIICFCGHAFDTSSKL